MMETTQLLPSKAAAFRFAHCCHLVHLQIQLNRTIQQASQSLIEPLIDFVKIKKTRSKRRGVFVTKKKKSVNLNQCLIEIYNR